MKIRMWIRTLLPFWIYFGCLAVGSFCFWHFPGAVFAAISCSDLAGALGGHCISDRRRSTEKDRGRQQEGQDRNSVFLFLPGDAGASCKCDGV